MTVGFKFNRLWLRLDSPLSVLTHIAVSDVSWATDFTFYTFFFSSSCLDFRSTLYKKPSPVSSWICLQEILLFFPLLGLADPVLGLCIQSLLTNFLLTLVLSERSRSKRARERFKESKWDYNRGVCLAEVLAFWFDYLWDLLQRILKWLLCLRLNDQMNLILYCHVLRVT